MLGIFKKKSKKELLEKQYRKLLEESHKLSVVSRRASDEKMLEADRILKEIENLEIAK